jgi:hypothetical protein
MTRLETQTDRATDLHDASARRRFALRCRALQGVAPYFFRARLTGAFDGFFALAGIAPA